MPSGKTHDAITLLLAVPVFGIAWLGFLQLASALIISICFLFGGLMFGPDLDTKSVQYSRWTIFKHIWFPYKVFFKHRSRWSHGLIFGTLIRVVYFLGVLTLISFLAAFLFTVYTNNEIPKFLGFIESWNRIGDFVRQYAGTNVFYIVFAGLWLGAASHTFTDMAVTYIKTGKVKNFL